MDLMLEIKEMNVAENIIYFLNSFKVLYMSLGTYFLTMKISNYKNNFIKTEIFTIASIILINLIGIIIGYLMKFDMQIIIIAILLPYIISKITHRNISYCVIVAVIALSINYVILFIATALSFIFINIFGINNIYTCFIVIMMFYIIILGLFSKIKRIKNGLAFLQKAKLNDYTDMVILNISIIVLFFAIIFNVYDESITDKIGYALIIFAIIMFITIQKSLQIYYKQKLLVQELEETKNELEKKNKEIKELEQENLNFSKTSHTLAHKQKALEYKLNQLINQSEKNEPTKNNTNASKENNTTHQANKPENIETEQIQDIKERLAEISKDLYQNEKSTRLAQTGIKRIDDMLKYMHSESEKYNIKLELQITGNIHHMTNKIIEEKDLETLIADHVKNAIIAINHSKNENKSILVKLGKIEENYGLAIFDTGIEFENETLENLGKKPSTTHAEEGGTGMGFMNTFDTINKYKASLIINEIGKESETNYTKAIIIKFDQKNEFKIDSYRQQKSTRTAKK